MRVLDPGHLYELSNLDTRPGGVGLLQFVKRIGSKYPGNEPPACSGTTTQEVIRALIDRTKYVDAQIDHTDEVSKNGHVYNDGVISYLRSVLQYLEQRAAEERGDLEARDIIAEAAEIELMPTCDKCGHVMCRREDHR